ncbi:unnamed protein product [Auanema sp. JU1783]|nr:unnamed protein product [Auanema sp. JU1783]
MEEIMPSLRDQRVQGAVKSLIVYSLVILIVPLGSMFLLKTYLFEALLGYTVNDALTYSAVVAVLLVHVVLGFWIISANKTEIKKELKKQD